LDRQLFEIVIQAAVDWGGQRIVARETVRAARKDVTAKLYGGDRTRRMKLLDNQREHKKRLAGGQVRIPPEAVHQFLSKV